MPFAFVYRHCFRTTKASVKLIKRQIVNKDIFGWLCNRVYFVLALPVRNNLLTARTFSYPVQTLNCSCGLFANPKKHCFPHSIVRRLFVLVRYLVSAVHKLCKTDHVLSLFDETKQKKERTACVRFVVVLFTDIKQCPLWSLCSVLISL